MLVSKIAKGNNLSEGDQAVLDNIFKDFDANGDGKLQPSEIAAVRVFLHVMCVLRVMWPICCAGDVQVW